ncbi:MAG TPA: 6-carboxytetrahydropterin synthase [Bacteroidales bacterium]|jgi:6-pyruvoyltetrahydropterin/6-carboxytetrahydropterin synthase|nr:6-carboxytetrahydropterin synthase [Bacteroidales bacterium]HQH23156.1 6-carboxytetrahydropterin synthase [Bacteroidales bacterium]HQJ80986.1 6-carboxytetrahydropterin synthase [Bacteroidales bacterium]
MSIIRVTREFSFEMAHALHGYDGPCKNVHGHSYRLLVTVSGVPVSDGASPKNGMLIDFNILREIVQKKIIDRFDHSLVISNDFDEERKRMMLDAFGNILILNYQPTCEKLVENFAAILGDALPTGVKLHSLRLYETAKSYAEWYASDNE